MNSIDKLYEKIKSMSSQDIKLLCGELTAGEMRTLKAYQNWIVRELDKIKNYEIKTS